jgi:hypothetical protein
LQILDRTTSALQFGFTIMRHTSGNIESLTVIPGVGKSIAQDLHNIGIQTVSDLRGKNPEILYDLSNQYAGVVQDRCLLYIFRTAVYFAENKNPDPEKLKWWNWKDKRQHS